MQACSGNLCAKFHTLSFINNIEKSGVLPIGFSSFLEDFSSFLNGLGFSSFLEGFSSFLEQHRTLYSISEEQSVTKLREIAKHLIRYGKYREMLI